MPLLYTHNINDNTRLGVWHITEDEDFFRKSAITQIEITHPHKRLQHFAGRFLLKFLHEHFPLEHILLEGKRPFLQENQFHFSISHCGDYAAAMISEESSVGIDVELVTEKLAKLEKKYLDEPEMQLIRQACPSLHLLQKQTACWSAKEAMFKWYRHGQVDFRRDMVIHYLSETADHFKICAHFGKGIDRILKIEFRFFDELCMAWVK